MSSFYAGGRLYDVKILYLCNIFFNVIKSKHMGKLINEFKQFAVKGNAVEWLSV